METLTRLLYALVALSGVTCLGVLVLCYELRQLRAGKASMTYWERVEAIRRDTTPTAKRSTFFNA